MCSPVDAWIYRIGMIQMVTIVGRTRMNTGVATTPTGSMRWEALQGTPHAARAEAAFTQTTLASTRWTALAMSLVFAFSARIAATAASARDTLLLVADTLFLVVISQSTLSQGRMGRPTTPASTRTTTSATCRGIATRKRIAAIVATAPVPNRRCHRRYPSPSLFRPLRPLFLFHLCLLHRLGWPRRKRLQSLQSRTATRVTRRGRLL